MFNVKTDCLVRLRQKKAYSQERMGELLLMDRSNYGKIERGERELTLRIAYEIAQSLDASIEEFVNLPNDTDLVKDMPSNIEMCGAVSFVNDAFDAKKIIMLLESAVKLLRSDASI